MSAKNYGPYTPRREKTTIWVMNNIGRWQTIIYELTGGRIWNTLLGAPVAILTVKGRKSGRPRKVPLLYMRWEENIVMVASKAGTSKLPFWYRNAVADSHVQIQVGSEKVRYRMREATEQEEEILWPKLDAIYPGYEEYRARTEGVRRVPVCVFERAE